MKMLPRKTKARRVNNAINKLVPHHIFEEEEENDPFIQSYSCLALNSSGISTLNFTEIFRGELDGGDHWLENYFWEEEDFSNTYQEDMTVEEQDTLCEVRIIMLSFYKEMILSGDEK